MSVVEGQKEGSFLKENSIYIGLFLLVWSIACYAVVFQMQKGEMIIFFSDNRHEGLNYFFRFCTLIGEAYVYVVAVIVFMFIKYSKSLAIIFNSFFVIITSQLLKDYFQHHRPVRYFEEFASEPNLVNYVPGVVLHDSYVSSFPSGHTTSSFAFYSLLAFFIPHKGAKIVCLMAALLVGMSRMYLVQHFLKDVVAGSMLGFCVALFTYWLIGKLEENFGEKYKLNHKYIRKKDALHEDLLDTNK